MTMDALYPDPPHLTIAVWVAENEEVAFGRSCDVVDEFGCLPSGIVEVASRGQRFAMVQDLEDRSVVQLSAADFESMVHGRNPVARSLKAGYRGRGLGTVVVEHLLGTEAETHPVAVSVSAGALGIPAGLWRSKDRRSAYKLAGRATDVLRELASRTGAAYGAIAVEETLPTPSALRDGALIGSLPFLSANLPIRVQDKFRAAFGRTQAVNWADGTFFPGWEPFAGGKPPTFDRVALAAASAALGNALAVDAS
ncbi:hypothetical protein ACWEOO_20610 [Kribbella sp. NPDC004138]